MGASDDVVRLLPNFACAEVEEDCLFHQRVQPSHPGIPSSKLHFKASALSCGKFGVIQSQELVLEYAQQVLIELTI